MFRQYLLGFNVTFYGVVLWKTNERILVPNTYADMLIENDGWSCFPYVSNNGINFIANLEVDKRYLVLDSDGEILQVKPSVGNTTIGYGYDLRKDPLDLGIKTATNISHGNALDYLLRLSDKYAKTISSSSDITIQFNQCQIDALVSLRYNVGALGEIPNMLNDINNKVSYNKFLNDIISHYENLVKADLSNAQYLEGWKGRAKLTANLYYYNDYGSMPINAVKGVYNGN